MSDKSTGVWAVIFNEGKNYIGKITSAWTKDASGNALVATAAEDMTKNDVLVAERVTLCPAYDFFSPLRPVAGPPGPGGQPTMGFSRDPIVTPFDFCVNDVPVHVRVGGVMFFDEMQEGDRATYQSFIDQATRMQMQQRASRAGLSLENGFGDATNVKDLFGRK